MSIKDGIISRLKRVKSHQTTNQLAEYLFANKRSVHAALVELQKDNLVELTGIRGRENTYHLRIR